MEFIDKIYYINLDQCMDRKNNIEKEIKKIDKYNLNFLRSKKIRKIFTRIIEF